MMGKLILQVRTNDNLLDLLANNASPAWVVAQGKEREITHVQVVNWEGSQMIEGVFDPASPRREDDGRRIVRFLDGRIVNCRVEFASQMPVRYFE
jgi:hypothetical protein